MAHYTLALLKSLALGIFFISWGSSLGVYIIQLHELVYLMFSKHSSHSIIMQQLIIYPQVVTQSWHFSLSLSLAAPNHIIFDVWSALGYVCQSQACMLPQIVWPLIN